MVNLGQGQQQSKGHSDMDEGECKENDDNFAGAQERSGKYNGVDINEQPSYEGEQHSEGHLPDHVEKEVEDEKDSVHKKANKEQIAETTIPDVRPKNKPRLKSDSSSKDSTPSEKVKFRISPGNLSETDDKVAHSNHDMASASTSADVCDVQTLPPPHNRKIMSNTQKPEVYEKTRIFPSRSRSLSDLVEIDEQIRPNYRTMNSQPGYKQVRHNYGTMHSQPATEVISGQNEDYPDTEYSNDDYPYGYMPGMDVEITQNEPMVAPQRLPETLRHVMLHVIGSRPSEEIKFRRLKYKLDAESQPYFNNYPVVPRVAISQRPRTILRQQSKRPLRQRSHDGGSVPGSIISSRDPSYASISRPETPGPSEGTEILPVLVASGDQEKRAPTGLRNTTSRQKGVLIVLAMNDAMASMALSILAPFFPKEARQKGISDAMSGWVFGIFALVQCLSSPIFGKVLPRVGAKFLCQSGQFFAGGCTVLFGMLQFVSTEDNGTMFIVYCFVLRMFMALGCAATGTSAFAIAARTFPDNPATVFGLLETAVGFGLMIGPALGGVLYEVGGFAAPFAAIGTAMVLIVPIGVCILPSDVDEEVLDSEENISVRDFLKVPAVAITSLAAFIACMAWVIPDPTLEPHLSKFNLSPTIIGLVFLLMAACYAVCSPVWGWVADNVEDSAPMIVIGFIGTGIGFLGLGPSPIFPLPPDFAPLWLDIVALIVIGLSISLALVPTFDKILDGAEKAGIQDTLSNCSTVAGLWNASYSFGEFVGPVLAGWMAGKVGFAWTMSLASGLCFLMAVIMLILYLYENKFGPTGVRTPSASITDNHTTDERTPLLDSVSA